MGCDVSESHTSFSGLAPTRLATRPRWLLPGPRAAQVSLADNTGHVRGELVCHVLSPFHKTQPPVSNAPPGPCPVRQPHGRSVTAWRPPPGLGAPAPLPPRVFVLAGAGAVEIPRLPQKKKKKKEKRSLVICHILAKTRPKENILFWKTLCQNK